MKVAALSCPQCGGSQDVFGDQNLVECRYCRTQLRVKRTANGEVAQLLGENEILEIENALYRLEKEWSKRHQQLLVRGKRGVRVPSVLWGSIMIFGGCCMMAVGLSTWFIAGVPPEAMGIILALGSILAIVGYRERAAGARFQREKRKYEGLRSGLEERLAQLEGVAKCRRNYEDTTSRRRRLKDLSYPAADA